MSFVKAPSDAEEPYVRIEKSVQVSEKLKTALLAALQDEFGREIRVNVTSHFAKQEGPEDQIRRPIEVNLRFKQGPISPEADKGRR